MLKNGEKWIKDSLEVRGDAAVPLWEDGGVLDPGVSSCRHVPYYWLLVAVCTVAAVGALLVAAVALFVLLVLAVVGHAGVLARVVGVIGCRVGRGCVRGSTGYASLVVGRGGDGTESCNAVCVQGLAAAID
jgi:hypothetical protein